MNMLRTFAFRSIVLHTLVSLLPVGAGSLALAQPTPTPPTPTAPQTPVEPETKPTPTADEPTLDELLGLPSGAATQPQTGDIPSKAPINPDAGTGDAALRKALQDAENPAGFSDIVTLMSNAGTRLTDSADAGLDTQRTQEDALRKLDKLISDAKKQQQKKKQKSKSKDSKQQQSPSEAQQQQQQQSSQGQSKASQQSSSGGGPDRRDGPLKPPLAGGEATWGNLPPHVRDALRQGSSDSFSALYRTLTEQYYKRLAEDPRGTNSRGERP